MQLLQKSGLPESFLQILLDPPLNHGNVIAPQKAVRCALQAAGKVAGSSVLSLAGKNLKPSVLELEANDAFNCAGRCRLGLAVELAIKGRWPK